MKKMRKEKKIGIKLRQDERALRKNKNTDRNIGITSKKID